jgi:hypothetical protein
MLFVELPRRPTPPELLAITDPDAREAACAAFVAEAGVERFAVPAEIASDPAALQGFVEGQLARFAAEAEEQN